MAREGGTDEDDGYLSGQPPRNNRPLHTKVAHYWCKTAPSYGLLAFQVCRRGAEVRLLQMQGGHPVQRRPGCQELLEQLPGLIWGFYKNFDLMRCIGF